MQPIQKLQRKISDFFEAPKRKVTAKTSQSSLQPSPKKQSLDVEKENIDPTATSSASTPPPLPIASSSSTPVAKPFVEAALTFDDIEDFEFEDVKSETFHDSGKENLNPVTPGKASAFGMLLYYSC